MSSFMTPLAAETRANGVSGIYVASSSKEEANWSHHGRTTGTRCAAMAGGNERSTVIESANHDIEEVTEQVSALGLHTRALFSPSARYCVNKTSDLDGPSTLEAVTPGTESPGSIEPRKKTPALRAVRGESFPFCSESDALLPPKIVRERVNIVARDDKYSFERGNATGRTPFYQFAAMENGDLEFPSLTGNEERTWVLKPRQSSAKKTSREEFETASVIFGGSRHEPPKLPVVAGAKPVLLPTDFQTPLPHLRFLPPLSAETQLDSSKKLPLVPDLSRNILVADGMATPRRKGGSFPRVKLCPRRQKKSSSRASNQFVPFIGSGRSPATLFETSFDVETRSAQEGPSFFALVSSPTSNPRHPFRDISATNIACPRTPKTKSQFSSLMNDEDEYGFVTPCKKARHSSY